MRINNHENKINGESQLTPNKSHIKIKRKVDINYLLNFNRCFYGVFTISYFNSVGFAFFELIDNFFV